jgi:hypothetical protein
LHGIISVFLEISINSASDHSHHAFVHKTLLTVFSIFSYAEGVYIRAASFAQWRIKLPICLPEDSICSLPSESFSTGKSQSYLKIPPLKLVDDLILAIVAKISIIHVLSQASEHTGLSHLNSFAKHLQHEMNFSSTNG